MGLAGQGDSGLKESEKLPLAPPHQILGSINEQTATSPWTVIGTHVEQSRALMSLAHAALIAKREGLVGRKWDTLSRDDQVKGIKVTAAFTAVHSGLTGYFEPDPNELILQRDSTVAYKGRHPGIHLKRTPLTLYILFFLELLHITGLTNQHRILET